MQVLLGIKEFTHYFFRKEYLKITYSTFLFQKQFSQATAKLIKEVWTLEDEYEFLKPSFFYKLLEKNFDKTMQHDAHEYFLYLLD